jgi:hypothetical protein
VDATAVSNLPSRETCCATTGPRALVLLALELDTAQKDVGNDGEEVFELVFAFGQDCRDELAISATHPHKLTVAVLIRDEDQLKLDIARKLEREGTYRVSVEFEFRIGFQGLFQSFEIQNSKRASRCALLHERSEGVEEGLVHRSIYELFIHSYRLFNCRFTAARLEHSMSCLQRRGLYVTIVLLYIIHTISSFHEKNPRRDQWLRPHRKGIR